MITTLNLGLLILRVIGGLTVAGHGAQKLFGWFEGPGFTKMSQGLQKQGFKPNWFWTGLVVLGEFGGGLSLAFGFLTPLGAAGIVGAMTMAIFKSHWKNGFFNTKRGIEFPLQLFAIAVGIGIAGPGQYSLDNFFGITFPTPWLFIILAVVALLVDGVGLFISRPAATTPAGTGSPASGSPAAQK